MDRLAREAPPALVTVLVGRDPHVAWRSPSRSRVAGSAAVVGAALVAIAAVSAYQLFTVYRPPLLLELSLLLGPLLLVARYPLMAWRTGVAAAVLVALDPRIHVTAQAVALGVVFCLAALRQAGPVRWWMYAFTLVPAWLLLHGHPVEVIGSVVGLGVVTVALDGLASTRRARHALAEQVEQTELEQARSAVLQERARIAREMHDVVAHHMSMIAVQAETAPYRLHDPGDEARAEFLSLSAAARAAMVDMRRLLGVLRDDEAAERAPQPQLADMPRLIEATCRAGLSVELAMPSINNGDVPPGVGVCAYRIVQEALSNASRHAPGAPVAVTIDLEDHSLRLEVWNVMPLDEPQEPGEPATNGERPGHGLAGMRERVSLLGGRLFAGEAQGRYFLVSATLPLDEGNPGVQQ